MNALPEIFTLSSILISIGLLYQLVRHNGLKNATKLIFFVFLITLIAWTALNYFSALPQYANYTLSLARLLMVLAVMQTIIFYLFTKNFPHSNFKISHKNLSFVAIVFIGASAICLTPYLFSEISWQGNQPLVTSHGGIIIFMAVTLLFITLGIYELIKKYKTEINVIKYQSLYLLIAALIMFGMLFGLNVIAVNYFNNTSFIILGGLPILIFAIIANYIITRYRLFDITVRLRRSLLLAAGMLFLVVMIILLDKFLFQKHFNDSEQLIVLAVTLLCSFICLVWYTHKVGVGDPISLAVLDPVHHSTTVQELIEKLHQYLGNQFALNVQASYILDIDTKQFAHSQTGAVINLPADVLSILQQNQTVTRALRYSIKSAATLLPLNYNGYLVGFVVVDQFVDTDIQNNLQPFAGLIYQTLFASYLKRV